jgi:hypothetical protein
MEITAAVRVTTARINPTRVKRTPMGMASVMFATTMMAMAYSIS